MTPVRLPPEADFGPVLRLIRAAFAGMEGRIDPPSSMHGLSEAALAAMARAGEVWVIGVPVVACVVLTPQAGHLYLGKLAVAEGWRGRGLARVLVDLACARAAEWGLPAVQLQTRVELVENHAVFAALGFVEVARTAHAGYDRPTSVTFRKDVA